MGIGANFITETAPPKKWSRCKRDLLKPNFTREYKKSLGIPASQTLKFWQKRFWDHVIRDDRDFENHLHYMHFNPVKHGYVKDPRDWQYSSYIEWEERWLYPVFFRWDEPKDMDWGE